MDDCDYGYESSFSSDSEVSTKWIKSNTSDVTIVVVTTTPLLPPRIGNCRGGRLHALQNVRSWDDDMFRMSPLPYGHSTFTVRYGCFRTALTLA
jgi:hypothetical protein